MTEPIYAFLINHNRLTLPKRMADYLAECEGIIPVIVDNCSTYPELLSYYETCPHTVIRLDRNWGNCVLWHGPGPQQILNDYGLQGNFIVSDPDLEIDHIPKDWPEVFRYCMDKYQDVWKVGFGLRRDDLPDTWLGREAYGREGFEWMHPLEGGKYYRASIDTTFCLCRTRRHDFAAIRTGEPYLARHAPWYYTSYDDMPLDEQEYVKNVSPNWNYWTSRMKERF